MPMKVKKKGGGGGGGGHPLHLQRIHFPRCWSPLGSFQVKRRELVSLCS